MDSPSLVSSIVTSPQTDPKGPFLACIRTLKLHFEHGGVDKKGHDMLYRMIQMSSAIGWEMHVSCCSEIPLAGSIANMQWYSSCILQGCETFRVNMRASVKKAIAASGSLPELKGNQQATETDIKKSLRKLRALHNPTGNDRRLFELMLNHYDDVAFQRLVQLHLRKPKHGLKNVIESAKSVYMALEELHHLAQQADELVLALDQRFTQTLDRMQKNKIDYTHSIRRQRQDGPNVPELLASTACLPKEEEPGSKENPYLSRSFGIAEGKLTRRGHVRAATFSETCYTAAGGDSHSALPGSDNPLQRTALSTKRRGTNVPRIFTGSFSQLESNLRKLQLDQVETPVTNDIEGSGPVKIRDFGVTPAVSPCRTQSPPPLQRREALVSRDIEFQDRLIKGEVVKSRRPSTKTRAQTLDDSAGGLEAWLKEPPSGQKTAVGDSSAVRRGHLKHRERTL